MSRLARRLFTLCSAASLLLFAATCVLWMRSRRTTDEWVATRPDRRVVVSSLAGRLAVDVQHENQEGKFLVAGDPDVLANGLDAVPQAGRWEHYRSDEPYLDHGVMDIMPNVGRRGWERLGFIARDEPAKIELIDGTTIWAGRWRCAAVPYWAVAVPAGLLGLPLLSRARTWVRSRRHRGGHCPSCGYDLRASPGRCPECGSAAARKATRDDSLGGSLEGVRGR